MFKDYDIIVIGAGHAGCEAAVAAAHLNTSTLLITMDMNKIAQMSCNPAVGGIAKGQIVREIDALGGQMGIVTDRSSIQFRMLNRSKGPAMWSPRAQCDRMLFSIEWRKIVEDTPLLDIWQDQVRKLWIEDNTIKGVITQSGIRFFGRKVILTTGTFLNGLIHIGSHKTTGGRIGEPASIGITVQLKAFGFETGRMKTGTPPRLDGKTIDFSKMRRQDGDIKKAKFSFLYEHTSFDLPQLPCYVLYTNKYTHNELQKGFDRSPMHNGTIQSVGPRYCPSIEAKLTTFPDKNEHLLFLEPEGIDTNEYYLNGFSSALPPEVQLNAIRQIPGMEKTKMYRPGYAIEYDYFVPTQLFHTLETKHIKGLYFAGQINGTTGYEEAGAQGLIAGINAALSIREKRAFILQRNDAYIGVLIDDLVTKSVDEPYRMFTSRAEYRILLRQDNADMRLTKKGVEIGLASQKRYELLQEKRKLRDEIIHFCKHYSVKPTTINSSLTRLGTTTLKQSAKLINIVVRPQITLNDLIPYIGELKDMFIKLPSARKSEIIESAEIMMKYAGYIDREKSMADKLKRLENIYIKDRFDYHQLKSMSTEARQKLSKIRPRTIGQASRIPGVSPADINVLLVLLKR